MDYIILGKKTHKNIYFQISGVHGMPSNNLHITKNIKFLHPKSMQENWLFAAFFYKPQLI